jgi:dienelactone hydrolase
MVVRSHGGDCGIVELRAVPPPAGPVPETPEDHAAFRRAFAARPSRPPEDPGQIRAWKTEYRERLWNWLMPRPRPRRPSRLIRSAILETHAEFEVHQIVYRSRPRREVTALLALPRSRGRSRSPLLLALHGHEATWGQADLGAFRPGHADDFCEYFASRGFAVLQTPTLNHVLQAKRWTLFGEWLWDAMTGLDSVTQHEAIDMDRIGIVGLSTGGFLTLLATAMDDRIRCAVAAGSFTTVNHFLRRYRIPPHCDCGSLQYLFNHVDFCDIAAVAAPKPLQVQHGRKDHPFCPGADPAGLHPEWNTGVMPTEEFEMAVAEVRRAYGMDQAAGRFAVHFHEKGHAVDNATAFAWISHGLA